MSHLTHYKRVPLTGLSVAMIGTAILAAFSGQIPLLPFCIILAIVSIGFGTLLPVATVSIQNAVQPHQLGTVTAVANFFRQIGGALIVAVFGAIVLGGVGGAAVKLSPEALKLGTVDRETMVVLFRYVFGAASLGFALAWLSLARMRELPLRGHAVEAAKAIGGE
jgi:MFS family permease